MRFYSHCRCSLAGWCHIRSKMRHAIACSCYSRHCSHLVSVSGMRSPGTASMFFIAYFSSLSPAVKSMTFDIIFIYSLLFFAFIFLPSFRQSWCFCRVVLLFFSFLLFSRGRNGNAYIESIQISLLFRYYSRCVFSLIPTRRSDREKQESQQRKTRETKKYIASA